MSQNDIEGDILVQGVVNNSNNNNDMTGAETVAHVTTTDGYQNNARGADVRTADQAEMEANNKAVSVVKVTDESGESVQQQMVELLGTL